MSKTQEFRIPIILSIIILVLAIVASAGGLLIKGLYRDNTLITSAWYGNDFVTIAIAVPLMILSLLYFINGSIKAQLVWIGILGYMLYNYIFYLYGATFNEFFLIYVAIFTLSVYTLILTLIKVDANEIYQRFSLQTPVKWVSSYMLFFGVLLGGMWIAISLSFVFTGQVPHAIVQTDHPTGVVFATDLSILIPIIIVSAILLWKRQPWGYVFAPAVLVKASTYGIALIAMSLYAYTRNGVLDSLLLLWIFLSVGCLVCCLFLLANIRSSDENS